MNKPNRMPLSTRRRVDRVRMMSMAERTSRDLGNAKLEGGVHQGRIYETYCQNLLQHHI